MSNQHETVWTESQIAALTDLWGQVSQDRLIQLTGHSWAQIENKRCKLGLTVPPLYAKSKGRPWPVEPEPVRQEPIVRPKERYYIGGYQEIMARYGIAL